MSEENCRAAFQASLELIKEKCGVSFDTAGRMVTLREVSASVKVPPEVEKIASSNPELTHEQRIEAVAATEWARNWAQGMVGLVAPGLTGREREEAINRLSRKLAERVV